jgi:capsular polysaccharide transport system ATP-binding protein
MIRLDGVSKIYPTRFGEHIVLDDVTVELPRGRSVGILGRNGAGKSTLVRLIAGADLPTRGRIERSVSVSWPLGFSGGFQPTLTGVDNIRFVCRIYGVSWRDTLPFIEDFAELGNYLDMPFSTYSSGMRARLAFAVSLAVDFDCYLLDELTAVGDARFAERCRAALADRRTRADIIMVSHNPGTIRSMCDMAAVLHHGKLFLYDDVERAIEIYHSL